MIPAYAARSIITAYNKHRYQHSPSVRCKQYICCNCAADIGQIRSMKTAWMQYDISIRCIPAYAAIPEGLAQMLICLGHYHCGFPVTSYSSQFVLILVNSYSKSWSIHTHLVNSYSCSGQLVLILVDSYSFLSIRTHV